MATGVCVCVCVCVCMDAYDCCGLPKHHYATNDTYEGLRGSAATCAAGSAATCAASISRLCCGRELTALSNCGRERVGLKAGEGGVGGGAKGRAETRYRI